MRTHLFRAMFAVIVSLACATSVLAQAGMIKGKVLDPKGQPVEGAKVEIVSAESEARKYNTTTDKKGEFVQIGLRSGAYKVTASKDKVGAQALNANVRQGGQGANLTFNLSPISSLSAADQKTLAALQAAYAAGAEAAKAGNHDLAIAKFQEAIAASPNCKDCYVNIGFSQTEKKNYTEAEAAFKKAIELDANAAEAYSGLAALYNAQKKYDLAAEAGAKAASLSGGIGAAVQANPNMALAQYQLGMTALNLGQIPDAVKALEIYLQLEPNGEKAAEVKAALPALKAMVK
jgi:tetratricopeptide (TPR) repeat protein